MLGLSHKSYFILILFMLVVLLILIIQSKNQNSENFDNLNHKKNSKKIIAFSLWGNNECYNWGAVENALVAKNIYPGWICRFYVAEDIIPEVKEILKNLDNVELVEMSENRGSGNMFWRFKPMFEEDNLVVLSRDTDSRLNIREKKCVDEWLGNKNGPNKDLLILRDHKNHNQLIMGGMFGVKNNVMYPFLDKFESYLQKNQKGKYMDDQIFLRNIYRDLEQKNKLMIYDAHHHLSQEKINQYPQTNFKGYIGQIVCNDFKLTNKNYGKNLQKTSVTKPYQIPEDSAI